jgi:predicted TIM-barrel fold metal-dependent hydrolase
MTETRESTATVEGPPTPQLLIDVDGHNMPTVDDLKRHMPERWARYLDTYGYRTPSPELGIVRARYMGSRADSWSPSGKPPGADVDFFTEQLLDEYGYTAIVLNNILSALQSYNGGAAPQEFTRALIHAGNAWAEEVWLSADERYHSSIMLPLDDSKGAVAELERWAEHPRYVGVVVPFRTPGPIGNRKYWDILDAASHYGLPLGFHPGNGGNVPLTGAGFPSFYYEDHTGLAHALASQLGSLVCEGVFDRWPNLRFLIMEGGWTWIPAFAARFDTAFAQLGDELPDLQRKPSEYIRDHFWYSTQPIEEPPKPEYLVQCIEQFDLSDRLLFSSDYPHWDFDPPTEVARLVPSELRDDIMGRNAARFFPKLSHFADDADARG